MTAEVNPLKPWDFQPIIDLIEAFQAPLDSRTSRCPRTPPSPSPLYKADLYNPKTSHSLGLGDFNRLYDFLGKPHDITSNHRQHSIESSSSFSNKSTPPSSVPDDRVSLDELVGKSKGVRWTDEVDEVDEINIEEIRRRNTHASSIHLVPALKTALDDADGETSTCPQSTKSRHKPRVRHVELAYRHELESETELVARPRSKQRIRVVEASEDEQTSLPSSSTLIPSSVTPDRRLKPIHTLWIPPDIPKPQYDSTSIRPIATLTRQEKYAKLVKKLQKRLVSESGTLSRLTSDQAMKEYGGNNSPDGIHVFVDCSNIVIGFVEMLKMKRGMATHVPAKGGVISWHALALVLERGRPVARRILVGSHGSPLYDRQPKRPDYMVEAEKCGYEVNVLDRVLKLKDPTPTKNKRGTGNGYATTSGYSSGSDGAYMRKAVAEQAVDEILHMKLLESLIDMKEPSTIVLASGDAAEAEYSGGFMKNVERALMKGWKVELIAWSAGLSKDYQSKEFLRRWKGKFSIILLDDFSEELLAMYTTTAKPPKGVREFSIYAEGNRI